MAARSESARRVSDCVTALLRDQPFFGSLALRLPIRADATRETLASDGKDIRYAPQWVADTDADRIKTALARVVLACALKHHRRGGRDPERWQRASQLVTHGLLRDAGFVLPPEAEAWDGISAEQAYDRLPEPSTDAEDPGSACPSSDVDDSGSAASPQSGGGYEDQNDPSDPTGDNSPQEQDEPGSGSNSAGSKPSGQMPASHDPCGTGEVMDADERRGDATGQSGESPLDTPAEEQAWTRPCIRPRASPGRKAIPMTVRSSLMPRTSCGAPMAFGCSRWTTAGAGSSPPSSIGTPSVSAGMSASAATASPPCSRSPWGLPGCMARPRPARLGGWPCGWITAPSICRTTSPTRSSSGASSRPTPSVAEPQTNGVAERFNRTLKEQIIHGRIYRNIAELRDAVRDFVELYNAQWIVEKNGYLSPAQARQAWHAAISIRPAA